MIDTVNNLNWTVKNVRARRKLITKIIERAENMELKFDKMTLRMDLRLVDESIGLRLEDFLSGTDDGFVHDILGIQKNFNCETKEMDIFSAKIC